MVELRTVSKSFGDVKALRSVSLEIGDGEFFTLLGPSGSGKSTVLKLIAGLLQADEGDIFIAGESMKGKAPHEREVGVVFQSLALFPHLTVAQNIAFPLKMRRWKKPRIAAAVATALDLVQLPDIGERRVTELSGGQRQRVALARSLVFGPRLLLLDEPLSALDRRLREDMQLELTRLHREVGVTIINVTHDQREAMLLSERVALMDDGQVVQCGSSRDVYERPADEFVAAFLGDPLLVRGSIERVDGRAYLHCRGLRVRVHDGAEAGPGTVVLRPEQLRLSATGTAPADSDNHVQGVVRFSAFDGVLPFFQVELGDDLLAIVYGASGDNSISFKPGEVVSVTWNINDAPLLPGHVA